MVDLITLASGIILAIIATTCVNIGVALQKKGLKDGLPELNIEGGVNNFGNDFLKYFKNKYWVIGFFLGIIGWIPFVIAQGLVGIIVVQPLQSVGLIIMVIVASRFLDEKISVVEIIAIAMLILAPILIAFSDISNIHIDLTSFLIPFLVFLIIIFLLIFFFIIISKKQNQDHWKGLFKVTIAGLFFSLGGMFANILAQAYNDASINIISPFGWLEILFGIFWFDYFHLWVFLSFYGLLGFNFIGIIFQNNGLQKGKAVVLWPIQTSINLIVPVIGGFIIFQQSVNNLLVFIIAIVMIFIATVILSKFQARLE